MTTHVVDVDEEKLLRHFCLEPECEQVRTWFVGQGHTRPDEFNERLRLAVRLKDEGNTQFQAGNFQESMMHALGALHCLDFSQARAVLHDEAQKAEVNEALVPLLSNLTLVFSKRGDGYNSARAADLGLDYVKRLPASSADKFKPKFFFRRGVAKGQRREFESALADLREAARLCPKDATIRKALENCKLAIQQERGAPDDRWRGLLTDSPEKAREQARTQRRWKDWKETASYVVRNLWLYERWKIFLVIVLGPLVAWFGSSWSK